MQMEFLKQNFLITTTMVTVPSGSTSVDKLFDRINTLQYQTSGQSDTVAMTMTVAFSSTQSVDRIVLENHNLKSFAVYYNNTTTNLFSLGSGNVTSTSDFSTNSATSIYLHFDTPINCTSVSIVATTTMAADENKKIGQLWITEKQTVTLPFNPSAKGYKPKNNRKEFIHSMSDGGTALYAINNNFGADIKLEFLSATVETNLRSLYNSFSEFVFTPFPTGTAWNGYIFEVNWIGKYEFDTFTSNYKDNGRTGQIRLRETPK